MRAANYTDHIRNAGTYYERAMVALTGNPDAEGYARAKAFVEMSTLALDLAREARLYDASVFAQERALAAEREKADRAGKRGKRGTGAAEEAAKKTMSVLLPGETD